MDKKDKRTAMRIKAVCEIMEMCLEINGLEERTREKDGNLPTVFCEFSGHVDYLKIRIYYEGWYRGTHPDYQYDFSLDGDDFWRSVGNVKAELERLMSE